MEKGFELVLHIRAAEINKYPEIALDFGSDPRRGKGRIAVLCNLFHNAVAGPKDEQDWIIVFFRGPNSVAVYPALPSPTGNPGSVAQ